MPSLQTLKEILTENEQEILSGREETIPREGVVFPSALRKVCVIYGVRRSGKSTLLFDLFRKSTPRALYVDFEDDRLSDFKVQDFQKLLDSFYELKPGLAASRGLTLLLDEVQNVPGWEKFARRMAEREGAHVFVTGSSSKMMSQEIHTSLRGRSWGVELFPFSFREYVRTKRPDPGDKSFLYGKQKPLLVQQFREYLKWGGFPEIAFLHSAAEKKKVLKEYLSAMFFKDLVERFEIRNIPLVDHLQDSLFASFALKYSLSSFRKQFKDKFAFSKDLLFPYYRYFLESLLVFETRMLSESSYQRLRNPAKIYAADNGLAKRVTSADWGRLLENAVFLELRRSSAELFYYEGRRECDFAVRGEKGWALYQSAWELGEKNREREIEGLEEACRRLGCRKGTLLTYNDPETVEQRKKLRIEVKPAWKWLIENK